MTREEFIRAWYRTGQGRCFYCGALFGEGDTLFAKSIEHVYPKHTYKFMRYNEVQACRGCNFAKNGFEPEQFRDWLTGGCDFYCEEVIGQRLPPSGIDGYSPLRSVLHNMVKQHFNQEFSMLYDPQSKRQKALTVRLRIILRKARKNSLDIRKANAVYCSQLRRP